MSYIDKSKWDFMRLNQILEMENEMLRNQIRKLKIELNELLDNAQLQTKTDGERKSNGQGN
jgi:hypothetical protein